VSTVQARRLHQPATTKDVEFEEDGFGCPACEFAHHHVARGESAVVFVEVDYPSGVKVHRVELLAERMDGGAVYGCEQLSVEEVDQECSCAILGDRKTEGYSCLVHREKEVASCPQ